LFEILLTCGHFHQQTGGLPDHSPGLVADLTRQGVYDTATSRKRGLSHGILNAFISFGERSLSRAHI
jgi:hypothetical protein